MSGCGTKKQESNETDVESIVDHLPIDDYIMQHRNYANSEKFQTDIIPDDSEYISRIVEDVNSNIKLSTYNCLKKLSSILDINPSSFNMEDTYEILLAQIFFESIGQDSIREMYSKNYVESFCELSRLIILYLNENNNLSDEAINSLCSLHEELVSLSNSDAPISEIEEIIESLIDKIVLYDSSSLRKLLFEDSDLDIRFSTGVNFLANEIDIVKDSLSEMILLKSSCEAYLTTNEAFSDVILSMRKQLKVKSENDLFKPYKNTKLVTQKELDQLMNIHFLNTINPFGKRRVTIKKLAEVLESYYLILEESKEGECIELARKLIGDFKRNTGINLWEQGSSVVISLFSAMPIIKKYEILKSIVSAGEFFFEKFTTVEDELFNSDMVLKLRCFKLIEDRVIERITTLDWGKIPKNESGTLKLYQLHNALLLDEMIGAYKSTLVTQVLYAENYYHSRYHSNNLDYNSNQDDWLTRFEREKAFGDAKNIKCHNIYMLEDVENEYRDDYALMTYYYPVISEMDWIQYVKYDIDEVSFYTFDLNIDGIEELFVKVSGYFGSTMLVYTYRNKTTEYLYSDDYITELYYSDKYDALCMLKSMPDFSNYIYLEIGEFQFDPIFSVNYERMFSSFENGMRDDSEFYILKNDNSRRDITNDEYNHYRDELEIITEIKF